MADINVKEIPSVLTEGSNELLDAALQAYDKKRKQEEATEKKVTRVEAQLEAGKKGRDTEEPLLTATPVSRQSIYGDLLKEQEDLEEQLRQSRGYPPSDYMGMGEEEFTADPVQEAKILKELDRVRDEKEYRYANQVDGRKELNEIRRLRTELESAQTEQQKNNIQKQIDFQTKILQKKGVVAGVTAEGEKVPVQTATPESRPGILEPAMTKALANITRSIQSLYMPSEKAEPIIKDEDTATNLVAEITPILLSGPMGSFVVGKTLLAMGKSAGKAEYLAALLGPAVAESAITTTEEAATFAEDLFGVGFLEGDITSKKMAILAESILVDSTFSALAASGEVVTKFPLLGGILKAIPTLIFGGEKAAQRIAGNRVVDLLTRASRGNTTPQQQLELVSELREQIRVNFKEQTGVDFDDYLKALEKDSASIADGVDPEVIRKSGAAAQLVPEDKFLPLTADLIESDILRRMGSGIETGTGMPEFTGARQAQEKARLQEVERLGETQLPATEVPRTKEEIEAAAEQAGASARLKIKTRIQNELGELSKEEEQALDALDVAVEELRIKVTTSPAASGVNVPTLMDAERASDEAADVFTGLYKGADNQRKQVYEAYTTEASKLEVPADEFQTFLEGIGGEKEVGNVIQILMERNPTYGEVLRQLQKQSRELEYAIDSQIYELTKDIPKPKSSRAEDPNSWAAYDEQVRNTEENFKASLEEDPEALQEIKDSIGYQEIKLSNIEGLNQVIKSELRAASEAERAALGKMSNQLEVFVQSKVPEGSELANLRAQANTYFQEFQGFYKFISPEIKSPLRYGDDIGKTLETLSDAELASVQDGFNRLLSSAVSGDEASRVARQNVINIRTALQANPEQLAKFDDAIQRFYTNKLYGDTLSVYVDDILQETDPVKVAQKAKAMARQLSETMRSRQFAYLDQFVPGVRDKVLATADQLLKGGLSIAEQKKAVTNLQKDLNVRKKEISQRPEAVFADETVGGKFGSNAVEAAMQVVKTRAGGDAFEAAWESAGKIGKVGEDGLTTSQRELKTVLAQGISALLLSPASKQTGRMGSTSFKMLDVILESKAFNLAFKEGDPTRLAVDSIAAKNAGVQQSRTAGKVTGESITDYVKQGRDIVDALIRFSKGPLSREGRRQSMIARAFFSLVGGQDRVNDIFIDVFTNPKVADELFAAQQKILKEGLETDAYAAYIRGLNDYLLQRVGITSYDEWQDEFEGWMLTQEMNELGLTEEQPQ